MMIGRENTNRPCEVLWELLAGILIIGVLGQVVCLLISERTFFNAIGFWSGIAVSAFMALHMYKTLNRALDLQEADAMSAVRSGALLRYAAAVIGMLLVYFTGFGNPLAYVFGVLSLKGAAYLQPFTHGLFFRLGVVSSYEEPSENEEESEPAKAGIKEGGESE